MERKSQNNTFWSCSREFVIFLCLRLSYRQNLVSAHAQLRLEFILGLHHMLFVVRPAAAIWAGQECPPPPPTNYLIRFLRTVQPRLGSAHAHSGGSPRSALCPQNTCVHIYKHECKG